MGAELPARIGYDTTRAKNKSQERLMARGLCGEPTRNPVMNGKYCTNKAGENTARPGFGACWLHTEEAEPPELTEHHYYNRYLPRIEYDPVKKIIAEVNEDTAPLQTLQEINLARGILIDFINRYHTWRAAFIAWYQSCEPIWPHPNLLKALERVLDDYRALATEDNPDALNKDRAYNIVNGWLMANEKVNPRPIEVLDISEAVGMASEVTKMVERIQKYNNANAVSRREFVRIMQEIGNIIEQCVHDEKIKAKIHDKLGNLRLA